MLYSGTDPESYVTEYSLVYTDCLRLLLLYLPVGLGLELRVEGTGFSVNFCLVQGSGFRVQGSGFRVQDSGFRMQGSGFRFQDSGFRVQGLG